MLLLGTYTEYKPSMNILLVFIGVGWALINVNSYPMVVEMSKGSDIGKYTGYYYTFSMAQILTPILSERCWNLSDTAPCSPMRRCSWHFLLTMTAVRHSDSKPVTSKDKLTMPMDWIDRRDVKRFAYIYCGSAVNLLLGVFGEAPKEERSPGNEIFCPQRTA